jgi:hypothetical protein
MYHQYYSLISIYILIFLVGGAVPLPRVVLGWMVLSVVKGTVLERESILPRRNSRCL